MTAQSVQVGTIVIPNQERGGAAIFEDSHTLNETISFAFNSPDVRTLSTIGANTNSDVLGLLYVPDLTESGPCINQTRELIPQNVTRLADLPGNRFVAIAPWTSPDCALAYMEAARKDSVQCFIFYIPGDSTQGIPSAGDPQWQIGDNDDWKKENGYPVYALPSQSGAMIMQASRNYSGNLTDVPNGNDLAKLFDSSDYVRLFLEVDTGAGTALPSLWVFLLVVLGILIALIGLTSISMHWLQRRRRETLRRRVARGEVDLEALGIKRLTVPQELMDEMPLYTYGTRTPVARPSQGDVSAEPEKAHTHGEDVSTPPAPMPLKSSNYRPTPLSQPTCAICLEDFVLPGADTPGTTVRELPCHHIFHPECVDTFLKDNSSLCPMCKKSALPRGYCPKVVTNAMVRRERIVRQLREQTTAAADAGENGPPSRPMSFGNRLRTRTMSGLSRVPMSTRGTGPPLTSSQQMEQFSSPAPEPVAPLTTASAPPIQPASTTPPIQPPSNPTRREWARQRAIAMLGPRAPIDPEAEEARTTPAWRKAVRGLFPGFRQ